MLLAEPCLNEDDDMHQLEGVNLLNSNDYPPPSFCEPSSQDEMGIDFGESHSSTYTLANKGNEKSNQFVCYPATNISKFESVENKEKICANEKLNCGLLEAGSETLILFKDVLDSKESCV